MVLVLAGLTACGPVTASDGQDPLKAIVPGAPGSVSAPAPSSGPVVAPAGGMRVVHSPGVVTNDETLSKGQCVARNGGNPAQVLPDPVCTPGAIDPAVTQQNIKSTICATGYTGKVRPPLSVTSPVKGALMSAYGIKASFSGYELDHLVPLELGGANSISNLWPEIGGSPNPKDTVENRLRREVCAGTLPLAQAQSAIAADWLTAP